MPRNLDELLSRLCQDTESVRLPAAADVRRRGDRRRHRRRAGLAVTASVLVGLVVGGVSTQLPRSGPGDDVLHPATAGPGRRSVTPGSAPSGPARPPDRRPVPASAMLQPAEIGRGYQVGTVETTLTAPDLDPCGKGLASDAARTAARRHTYDSPGSDGIFTETVVRYLPGAAARALREVRASVRTCPDVRGTSDTTGDRLHFRYRIAGDVRLGDEAFLVTVSDLGESDRGRQRWDRQVLIVRVGDTLAFVEYGNVLLDVDEVTRLGPVAARRL